MNLTELQRLAEAATPGPWKAGGKSVSAEETEDRLGMDVRLYGGHGQDNARNARHIAAFDPPTVLKLIAIARAAIALKAVSGLRAEFMQDELADLNQSLEGIEL